MNNKMSIPARFKGMLFYDSLKPALPKTVMVEPASACNFKCITCSRQNLKSNRDIRLMDLRAFEDIISQFPELNNIIFCGIGEPLLNPDIVKMADKAKERRIGTIRLITNGSCMSHKLIEDLAPLLTDIQISINGFSPQSYARFNGVGAEVFEEIVKNIKMLVSIKDSSAGSLKVGLSAVLTNVNAADFDVALKFCGDLRVDSFIALQLNHFDCRLASLSLAEDEQRRIIKRLKKDEKRYGVLFKFLGSEAMARCYLLWNAAYISVDGAVGPCNGYYDSTLKWNILKDGFRNIWHSEDFIKMRKSVIEGRFPYCRSCSNGPSSGNITIPWLYSRYAKPVLKKLICRK